MTSEMVSVVITTCNRQVEILKEAIDSVIEQTYQNIEICLVNDGPFYEDRLKVDQLVKKYGKKLKYIVNEKPSGANYARNRGAEESKGVYLSFLDDDDIWEKTRVQDMVECLRNGADVIYSDMIIFNEKFSRHSVRKESKEPLKELLKANYFGGFSNVMLRKEIFEKVGRLDESLLSYQDIDLWIRVAEVGEIAYINKPLTYYRESINSISLNEEKKLNGLLAYLDKYEALYNQFPECKKIKLETEMVNFLKNGWFGSAKKVKGMLRVYENKFVLYGKYLKGILKNIMMKVVKWIQRR